MADQKVFLPDERPGMSIRDKNLQLAAQLSNAPNVNRNIVKILRDEANSGWEITYVE